MNPIARLGWGGFVLLGLVAAASPLIVQLDYAGIAFILLGLPHGASDLAVVAARRRPAFVTAYLLCIAVLLVWWSAAPFGALITLLVLSAIHFGIDDAPPSQPVERVARGLVMIAGPALLHRDQLTALFVTVTGVREASAELATIMAMMAAVAIVALPPVVVGDWRRGDRCGAALLGGGAAALVLLPPLVGFTLGFVLLHSRRQLTRRMAVLGYRHVGNYLRATAPILAGASVVFVAVVVLFARGDLPGAPILFAGIAALAIPHMLVTPLWTRAPRRVLTSTAS